MDNTEINNNIAVKGDHLMYLSNIDSSIRDKLKQYIPGLTIEDDQVNYQNPILEQIFTIPSDLYPLSKKRTLSLFTTYNTHRVPDVLVAEVFNALSFTVGHCYTNTENLAHALNIRGISDIRTFVGWIVPPSSLPLHHCWLLYKEQHVLDGGLFMKADLIYREFCQQNPHLTLDEYRKVLVELTLLESKKPHAESRIFGQVNPLYWYVGTECDPDDGRSIFNRLRDKYPTHPSYNKPGQNQHGASEIQKMIFRHDSK